MAQATACHRRRTRDLHHRPQLRVPGVRAQVPFVTGQLQVVEQQPSERDTLARWSAASHPAAMSPKLFVDSIVSFLLVAMFARRISGLKYLPSSCVQF